jgi:phage shock protein PspC (stress-responsive transcriptional regulator)
LDSNSLMMLNRLKFFFEKHGFHVSSRLADALGMRASSVRLFFIYLSFVTAGLWFAVYLILAFWMRLKDLIRAKRSSVFDI